MDSWQLIVAIGVIAILFIRVYAFSGGTRRMLVFLVCLFLVKSFAIALRDDDFAYPEHTSRSSMCRP